MQFPSLLESFTSTFSNYSSFFPSPFSKSSSLLLPSSLTSIATLTHFESYSLFIPDPCFVFFSHGTTYRIWNNLEQLRYTYVILGRLNLLETFLGSGIVIDASQGNMIFCSRFRWGGFCIHKGVAFGAFRGKLGLNGNKYNFYPCF